jgi:hypothetical protein
MIGFRLSSSQLTAQRVYLKFEMSIIPIKILLLKADVNDYAYSRGENVQSTISQESSIRLRATSHTPFGS